MVSAPVFTNSAGVLSTPAVRHIFSALTYVSTSSCRIRRGSSSSTCGQSRTLEPHTSYSGIGI